MLRAALSSSEEAWDWLGRTDRDIHGYAPDLIWIEVASGLRRGIRANIVPLKAGRRFLANALRLPIRLRSHRELAGPALDAALRHGLSAYDASYAVLAEALGATLITADRHLASNVRDSYLIT